MNKLTIKLSLAVFAFGLTNILNAQEVDKKVLNWYNGGGTGMQTEKAYKKLKKRKSETVVVAIIDSGVDIEHEDLQGKIWVNEDEIPGNGIDDDNNGYIDDIHGWNFLGNSSGENANSTRLERTRILAKLQAKSETETLSAEEADLLEKVKSERDAEVAKWEGYIGYMDNLIDQLPKMKSNFESTFDTSVSEEALKKEVSKYIKSHPDEVQMIATGYAVYTGELSAESLEEQKETFQGMIDTHHNPDFNGRAVVGDDPDDFSDTNYGNNDVEGPDALHGTHVGGIVGAIRGNDLGGDGVAENVKLMSLRAVPDGDEFDKDIALAIRYAVDNGASIINMSFGKAYSPHAQEVFEAFKYADEHGVLCIHAAGNDNKDIDIEPNFPTSKYSFQLKKLDHFMTIGSSTRFKKDKLASSFSNYGDEGVDVFAPGSEIYNSVPQSEYQELQGTSMACPMVSGVAAMLKSYFPELTMKEIKDIILSTATDYNGTMEFKPGTKEPVDFGTLSVTGGVVNVKNAVKACIKLEKEKAKA